ncbi:MAG TPA: D-alanyl-D-alanine carboxypeptidase family protein [Mesorhizobium sp.]|jgi:D-alanyl-D-alanine carboxypeptidase (penicillin-binding protein 5/6)|nr:D-alanyl-D-alanine carboxypeptidase family protein [Mesorhizobium sp.]
MFTRRQFVQSALLASAALPLGLVEAQAQLFETKAPHAYMIDAETGTILFAKEADTLTPPASLAKLMTMEVVFHAIKSGQYGLDDTFQVSENAWRTGGANSGGSTMFAQLNSAIRIEDLIQGVIVQSANDGCIILAEGIAGSEENFAALMAQRARQLGLEKSTFKNSTGLPAEGQVVTMRELVKLGMHIWRTYPEFYRFYSQSDFTWNKITQRNRNPLLAMNIGADGMKTGFTEESGYGIVGSVARDDKRVFAAMNGMKTDRERAEEARKLLEWGMRAFQKVELFAAGEPVGEASVYGGAKGGVALRAQGPVSILVPVANPDRLSARIVYQGPVLAPVEENAPIGALKVWIGETLTQETPLFAAESVPVGALHERAFDAVGELAIGWMR